MTCLHNIIWGYKKHFLGRNIKKSAASHMQRYAFLLKDARNYWKMFEGEGDKKKKVYPACSIVGQEGYTIMYSHSILCYEKHCLPHDYGELLRKQLPQFNLNMTGISTEPATTLPSPSGTKRGINLTTLKASLSNRGSSLVFTL